MSIFEWVFFCALFFVVFPALGLFCFALTKVGGKVFEMEGAGNNIFGGVFLLVCPASIVLGVLVVCGVIR